MIAPDLSRLHDSIHHYLPLLYQLAGEPWDAKAFFKRLLTGDSNDKRCGHEPTTAFIDTTNALLRIQDILLAKVLNRNEVESHVPKFYRLMHRLLVQGWNQQLADNHYSTAYLGLISFLSRILGPYEAEGAKGVVPTIEHFTKTLQHLVEKPIDAVTLERLTNQLMFEYKQFQDRTRNLEARMIQFERQSTINRSASDRAVDIIDQKLSGCRVPPWYYEFVYEYWQRYFHLHILKAGCDSEEIAFGLQVLDALTSLITIDEAERMTQQFAATFLELQTNVNKLLTTIVMENSVSQAFLDAVEQTCLSVMEQSQSQSQWISVSKINKALTKETMVEQLRQIKVGQWYRWRREHKNTKVKVLDVNVDADYVLLVNYSGARVASLTSSDFFQEHLSGHLELLETNLILIQALSQCEDKLNQSIVMVEKDWRERSAMEIKQRVIKRLEASRVERAKTEQARSQSKQRALERKLAEQRQSALSNNYQLLSRLSLGTYFIQHRPETKIVQFAVRLRDNEQMLFVDEKGVRVGQWTIAELAEKMVDNDIELIANQNNGESIMHTIVQQQRERRRQQTGEST